MDPYILSYAKSTWWIDLGALFMLQIHYKDSVREGPYKEEKEELKLQMELKLKLKPLEIYL